MKLDLWQGQRFLKLLDPSADHRDLIGDYPPGFTFQTFGDRKNSSAPTRVIHGKYVDVLKQLVALNRQGSGVFVTVNETDGKGRKKENIVSRRAIWIEDDLGLDVEVPLQHHIKVESSPGKYHRYFLTEDISSELHQALMGVMISDYGSDPNAKDVSRVLRIPGFIHQKGDPFTVNIVEVNDFPRYTEAQLSKAFLIGRTVAPRSSTPAISGDYQPLTEMDSQLPLPDITLKNCRKYLPVPGNQSRIEWLKVGMAFHHQFHGAYEALLIFDEWSQQVREYHGFDDVKKEWDTFGRKSSGTVTTFKHLVKLYNIAHPKKNSDDAESLIAECEDYMELMEVIAPKLYRLADKNVILERDFMTALINRYAELRPGDSLSKVDAGKAMRRKRKEKEIVENRERGCALNDPRTPAWARDWVWVIKTETWYNVVSGESYSNSAFRSAYDGMSGDDDNFAFDSARWLRVNALVPMVGDTLYAPNFDLFFDFNDVFYVNTYCASHRTVVPETITNWDAVNAFKTHIELMCGGWTREAQLLCNYLNVCTQDKPKKVRWAPLLIGDFGSGKSLFHTFMGKAMGSSNVKVISNTSIIASATSGQSGWAEGGIFGFIEELKLHGHNRHDVINTLKPYITNTEVSCRMLYQEAKSIPNTINYFATSNYLDCIPIEYGDRRWFVLQSKVKVSTLAKDYFDILHQAFDEAVGDMVCWLRSIPLHADFKPDGTAPLTEIKKAVILLTADDTEDSVAGILEESDDPCFQDNVVSFTPLFERLMFMSGGAIKNEHQYKLSKSLVALGFIKLPRTRLLGVRHSLWVKAKEDGSHPTLEEARDILTERLANSDDLGLI